MKIATGKVVDGKIVVDGAPWEGERGFNVTPEEEAQLLLSIAEADRGETVSAEEVLEGLARRRGEPAA